MKINTRRGRLLASTVLCGVVALAASAAQAQTAPAAPGAAAETPTTEIVVTGTRIKGVSNQTNPSPISVATQAQIQLTKAATIEDVLSHMTGADFTAGSSKASNNGGVGASEVSIRNLGPTRALVLIDGQRLIPTFGATISVPDLNALPVSMVDRIDVLRDGASSLYGADAIGGVINIITKKNANGMTADAYYGQTAQGDASYSISSSVGVDSDRGNVLVAISWDHTDAIPQSGRTWTSDPHIGSPGEPGSTYRGLLDLLQYSDIVTVWANGVKRSATDPTVARLAPNLFFDPGAQEVFLNAGGPGWNDLSSGLDRKQLSFTAHYNLTDNLRFVASGFFTNRTSDQSLRPEPLLPSGLSTNYPGLFIPSTTPGFLAAGAPIDVVNADPNKSGFLGYLTPAQFGPRLYHQDVNTYRLRTGFEGTIFAHYDWEAGFVYQRISSRYDTRNEGNFQHLAQITGQAPCVDVPSGCVTDSFGNSVPNVIPNFFNGPNIFTPAQVKYLTFDNVDVNTSEEDYAYANITGPVFDLPFGTVKAAVGGELRREHAADTPSDLVQAGYAPNPTAPTSGGYNVGSVFGELNIPLLKGLPFAEDLTVTPSVRYDHYSNFGGAFTNKVGVNWEIVRDLRFRGSYATGFRAPSVSELFSGQGISDITASGDPCDTRAANFNNNSSVGKGVLTAGSTCSKAVNGGAAVTNFLPTQDNVKDSQTQVLQGGNPALQPEQSESYTAGLVISPRWVPGLVISADYYNIRIKNTIFAGGIVGNTNPDLVLLGCYGPAQNQAFCNLITRDGVGNIIQINSLNTNFGTERNEGIDYEISYDTAAAHLDLPIKGSLHFDLEASQQFAHTTQNPDGTNNQYTGYFLYANESIQPKWKGKVQLDYRMDAWTFHWETQYFEHTENFDPTAGGHVGGNFIPDLFYHRISASYTFSDFGFAKKTRLTLGIDNLADQDPPFLSGDGICKCNTLAGPFDMTGRFFYGRISTSF